MKGNSHQAKINKTHNDDLVLVSDGHDAWIQLLPQIVIDFHLGTNCRANNRLDLFLENESTEQIGIRQDIIFGINNAAGPGARVARLAMLCRSRVFLGIFTSRVQTQMSTTS